MVGVGDCGDGGTYLAIFSSQLFLFVLEKMGFWDAMGSVGRVSSKISFWFLFVVFILVLIIGVKLYISNDYTAVTNGNISGVNCSSYTSYNTRRDPVTKWKCSGTLTYSVADKTYTQAYSESGLVAPAQNGASREVDYNPNNPVDNGVGKSHTGTVLLIVSVILAFIVLIAYLSYRGAEESPGYAQYLGARTTFNAARGWFDTIG